MYYLLIGDLIVLGFMVGLAAWALAGRRNQSLQQVARIPLEDEPAEHE